MKNIALIFTKSKPANFSDGSRSPGTGVWTIFTLSCLVNTLFLTGPIFMMQVYDRVLGSGNIATLIGLYAIAFLMYIMFGMFDTLRQQISTLRGEEIAAYYDGPAFRATLDAAASGANDARINAPEDVDTVRNFISSPGMMTFFDLPAIPFYFLAMVFLHPILGIVGIVTGLVLAGLAFINDRQSRQRMNDAQKKLGSVTGILKAARQDAESLSANGMKDAAQDYWQGQQAEGRAELVTSTRITSAIGSLTKALRLSIQSLVLAVGGWLAVKGQLSPGAMIAAGIVFSRSIAPFEQLLNNFRNLARAREAWENIQSWAPEYVDQAPAGYDLPAPNQALVAQNVSVRIPGQDKNLLIGVSVDLKAGDLMAIMGPSGVGKTSLVRTIVGAWAVSEGSLRLDGAELSQWPESKLGAHIGYLSQYTNLLNGTVAQNISRFAPEASSESVINVAKAASVHEMILGFEHGYETPLGMGAVQLSGGQRQRIGLARALYGDPFLLVLDEPSAHLDGPGKVALARALLARRQAGQITIITSHDETLLQLVNKLLVLEAGKMTMSGPKEAVIKQMQAMTSSAPQTAPKDASAAENVAKPEPAEPVPARAHENGSERAA